MYGSWVRVPAGSPKLDSLFNEIPVKSIFTGICLFSNPHLETLFVRFWFTEVSPDTTTCFTKIINDESNNLVLSQ